MNIRKEIIDIAHREIVLAIAGFSLELTENVTLAIVSAGRLRKSVMNEYCKDVLWG